METRTGTAQGAVDAYLLADFPWYGLDEAFTGSRWLGSVGASADGTVEHGSTGHGDEPSLKADPADADALRFAVVVTVARRPGRRSADGTGVLEATSVSSAAWLAGFRTAVVHMADAYGAGAAAGVDGPADGRGVGAGGRSGRARVVGADASRGRGADAVSLP